MDERDLVTRAIAGDEQAFLQLLSLYEDALYRIAYSYVKNEHDAVEAYQEMTYRSLKNIHKLKQPDYLKTWLIRILINICLDMKLKQSRVQLTNEIEQPAQMAPTNDLADIIVKLPLTEQQLIHLKYFEQYKNSEIADVQNIPEGTVKSRLHKTLRKLRSMVGERSEWE
ncbi:MAG: sigma-70 family RNA polymerase sigma factor [Solibacillus sp.]